MPLEVLLLDAMVASHLGGRVRIVERVTSERPAVGKRLSCDKRVPGLLLGRGYWLAAAAAGPASYGHATRFAQQRLRLSGPQVANLTDTYGRTALEVTRRFSAEAERAAQQAVHKIVAEGQHVRQGMATLREGLASAGVGPQPYLLETLVRTQVQMAYSAGRYAELQDPALDEIVWGYEYSTVGDGRVRPAHAALDGSKLAKDDPRWSEIWPPNGFNCRCDTIEIYDKGTPQYPPDTVQIAGQQVRPGADPDFRFHPGQVYHDITIAA